MGMRGGRSGEGVQVAGPGRVGRLVVVVAAAEVGAESGMGRLSQSTDKTRS